MSAGSKEKGGVEEDEQDTYGKVMEDKQILLLWVVRDKEGDDGGIGSANTVLGAILDLPGGLGLDWVLVVQGNGVWHGTVAQDATQLQRLDARWRSIEGVVVWVDGVGLNRANCRGADERQKQQQ